MNNSALPYWLALMVIVAASYGGWKWWQVHQFDTEHAVGGLEFEGPPLEEFELIERSGQLFRSRDMLGKVWVATFFFSTCPGSCSRLNANIQHLHNLEQLNGVTWVSITVDPQTDTLEKLREYADLHRAHPERWLFCRGEFDYVRRVGQDFMNVHVSYQGHQDIAVVIDKAGKIRGMYNAIKLSELEKLQKLLAKLIAEEPPGEAASTDDEATPALS